MSLYNPVSSVSNTVLGIGGGILGGLADGLGQAIGQATGSEFLGNIAGAVASQVTNEASRRAAAKLQDWAFDADDKLASLGVFKNGQVSDGALNIAGGLSFSDMWQNFQEIDGDNLSRRSFWIIEIDDRSGHAPVAKDGTRNTMFNLLTTNLSFNQTIINSEAVPVGSIELDKLQSSARTEMQLSVMDDEYGTIKRWIKRKALSTAQSDGTFLMPFFYLFDVRVVFGTNVALKEYYSETYTMRLADAQHELDRKDRSSLEEFQLKFVQWDTCMPSRIL